MRTGGTWLRGWAALAVMVGAAAAVGWAVPSSASVDVSFEGVASAAGTNTTITNPAVVPLGATAQTAGPVAQAALDSLGVSNAFAAAPYPGPEVAGAPGLIASLSGLPVPAYPLMVHADSTTTDQTLSPASGYALTAHSGATSTTASGVLGRPGLALPAETPAAAATASVTSLAGRTSVRATSRQAGFVLPGLVRFLDLSSTAQVDSVAGGKPVVTTALVVTGLSLLGQDVGYADGQLIVAGQRTAVPDTPLVAQLAALGVDVTYAAATRSQDQVVAATLSITTRQTDPTRQTHGTYTVVHTFGQASARLRTAQFDVASARVPVAADRLVTTAGAAAPDVRTPVTGAPALPSPALPPEEASNGPVPTVAAPLAVLDAGDPLLVARQVPLTSDWTPVFVALAAGALLSLLLGIAVRKLGVRAAWT